MCYNAMQYLLWMDIYIWRDMTYDWVWYDYVKKYAMTFII